MNEIIDGILSPDKKDYAIGYLKGKGSMPRNHAHNTYEIYYLVSGQRYYFIKDRTYAVKSGDIVLVNPYDLHRTISPENDASFERIIVRASDNIINFNYSGCKQVDLFACFKKGIPLLRFDSITKHNVNNLMFKLTSLNEE